MSDLKSRLMPLFRRSSTTTTATSPSNKSLSHPSTNPTVLRQSHSRSSLINTKAQDKSLPAPVCEEPDTPPQLPISASIAESDAVRGSPQGTPDTSLESPRATPLEKTNPRVTLEEPTPELKGTLNKATEDAIAESRGPRPAEVKLVTEATGSVSLRPQGTERNESQAHTSRITTLLESGRPQARSADTGYFSSSPAANSSMQHRKVWVKRPGSSATLVTINEDDLVDDVRDMILKKYANSLGRNFDAPDVTLRIVPRDQSRRLSQGERTLGPEEPICKTVETYFPGGQGIEDALIIDVPQRRTPRHSPRITMPYYVSEDLRPGESGTDYFPPMPVIGQHSPHLPLNLSVASAQAASHHPTMHSIAVLNTGQIPPLPSPGSRGTRHSSHRPKYGRTHTSSPTVISGQPSTQSHEGLKQLTNGVPAPPPLPTPPIPSEDQPHRVATPPPRASSPRPKAAQKRPKRQAKQPEVPASLLDGAVPPINVLIVEDNIINLKLLEAFMKRLKVRWHTAMNGKDAVTKWRGGGFHLVIMDIQMPVMNGLEATKEIRRLERVNNIGVFSNSASSTPTFPHDGSFDREENCQTAADDEDILMNTELFKSPVIIVALTASSLQSDRHEALAAGCNDFLTKPVSYIWLERKVMEWGCMQALIDFDGWRKWKDFSQANVSSSPPSKPIPSNFNGGALTNNNNNVDRKASSSPVPSAGGAGGGTSSSSKTKTTANGKLTISPLARTKRQSSGGESSGTAGTGTGTGTGSGSEGMEMEMEMERDGKAGGRGITAGA